jgi:hypothetical protein
MTRSSPAFVQKKDVVYTLKVLEEVLYRVVIKCLINQGLSNKYIL